MIITTWFFFLICSICVEKTQLSSSWTQFLPANQKSKSMPIMPMN